MRTFIKQSEKSKTNLGVIGYQQKEARRLRRITAFLALVALLTGFAGAEIYEDNYIKFEYPDGWRAYASSTPGNYYTDDAESGDMVGIHLEFASVWYEIKIVSSKYDIETFTAVIESVIIKGR